MVFHKTREQGEGVEQTGPLLLFRVHIHTIYTGFTHFCRKISLVAITRFGRQFLAKIWWEEAPKHFNGPGVDPPHTSGQCPLLLPFFLQESFPK